MDERQWDISIKFACQLDAFSYVGNANPDELLTALAAEAQNAGVDLVVRIDGEYQFIPQETEFLYPVIEQVDTNDVSGIDPVVRRRLFGTHRPPAWPSRASARISARAEKTIWNIPQAI